MSTTQCLPGRTGKAEGNISKILLSTATDGQFHSVSTTMFVCCNRLERHEDKELLPLASTKTAVSHTVEQRRPSSFTASQRGGRKAQVPQEGHFLAPHDSSTSQVLPTQTASGSFYEA